MTFLTRSRPLIQQHFAFAHGRIGVLTQHLLTQGDLDRLLGSADLKDAERVLTEIKWTSSIDQSLHTTDATLNALRQWLFKEIRLMVPASRMHTFDILWLDEDAPHLSYLLKKRHRLTLDEYISPVQPIAFTLDNLPPHLQDIARDSLRWTDPTAIQIDMAVAKWAALTKRTLAKKSGSPGILHFVIHTIDLHNIRTAVRIILRKGMVDASDDPWFFPGGSIPPPTLKGDFTRLRRAIDVSPLAFTLIEEHLNLADDPGSFERALAQVTARDITEMWNVPLSIDPVFAFSALVLQHLRVLKVLLMGKRNALSPQEIKYLLPPFIPFSHYVTA